MDIREQVRLDSNSVVEHLLNSDMEYWEAIKEQVIYPFLAPGTAYRWRIDKLCMDRDNVYDQIYVLMVQRKKLKNLRKREMVLSYIIQYVRAYILAEIEREIERSKQGGITVDGDPPPPVDVTGGGTGENPQKEIIEQAFKQLWQENPRRAVVFLLCENYGLSAEEVKNLLELASNNYVYQIVALAKRSLQFNYNSWERKLNK